MFLEQQTLAFIDRAEGSRLGQGSLRWVQGSWGRLECPAAPPTGPPHPSSPFLQLPDPGSVPGALHSLLPKHRNLS